jgi:type VI secretion system secreted protein VgrG
VVLEGANGRKVQVRDGSYELEVQKVDYILGVTQGNANTTVTQGDFSLVATAGKISMQAAQSIELKVGGSSILIEPKGVTIKGPLINIEAVGINTIKGAMVKINT